MQLNKNKPNQRTQYWLRLKGNDAMDLHRSAFIGAGSMGAGGQLPTHLPGIFFAPPVPSLPPLALGSNYWYLNKIIAKRAFKYSDVQ